MIPNHYRLQTNLIVNPTIKSSWQYRLKASKHVEEDATFSDSYYNADCVTWPNNHALLHFNCFELKNAMVLLKLSLALYDEDAIGMTLCQHQWQWHHMTKRSCCILFLWYWPKGCNGAIDNAFQCHMMPTPVSRPLHDQKSPVALHFNCIELRNITVPLIIASVSWKVHVNANGVIWQEKHIAPHFDHLDLRNAMMSLIMPLASHVQKSHLQLILIILTFEMQMDNWQCHLASVDTSANVTPWPQSHIVPYFDCLDLGDTVVPLMMSSALCDADTGFNGTKWPRMSCCIKFQLSWPKVCNSAINDASSITWC